MKPYIDHEITQDWIIREFTESIDPIELMWHRDDEDRVVEAITKTDWMIQLDNRLPINITEKVTIPRHAWHRLIKGSGSLTVKIHKKV
jgi:hypothetical protein